MFLLITEILKRYPYWTVISIHLMFLLIKPDIAGKELQRHISIHLMFLLIIHEDNLANLLYNFNTSHVSINLSATILTYNAFTDFNTSHVSINPYPNGAGTTRTLFQYISCFY